MTLSSRARPLPPATRRHGGTALPQAARAGIGSGIALLVLLLEWLPAGAEALRMVRSSSAEVVTEIDAPLPTFDDLGGGECTVSADDWNLLLEPGAPELPCTSFQVAIPPGTRPVLTTQVLASTFLGGHTPRPVARYTIFGGKDGLPQQIATRVKDPALYAQEYPPDWAKLGEPGNLRALRVVTVMVYPYRWDPSGGVRVATRLEVHVTFEPDAPGPSGQLQGFGRPQGRTPGSPAARVLQVPPASEGEGWDRLYRKAVVNGDQAAGYLRKPLMWQQASLGKAQPQGAEYRIAVDHSDIYRITYEELAAAGWSGQVPVDQLSLVERFYVEGDSVDPFHEEPVPILVRDLYDAAGNASPNGTFDPGDEILFFGLTAWDRLHPLPRDKRYGRENSYFLTVSAEGGARMASASSDSLRRTDLVPESTFDWTERTEGDGVYMQVAAGNSVPPGGNRDTPGDLTAGVLNINRDHFYWFGGQGGDYGHYRVPFNLPGIRKALGLRIALQGVMKPEPPVGDALLSFDLEAPGGGTPVPLPGPVTVPQLSGLFYQVGESDLQALPFAGGDSLNLLMTIPDTAYGAAADWVEWTWRRDFSLLRKRLAMSTNALAGPREFTVSWAPRQGPTADDSLLVFDVTDSIATHPAGGPARGPKRLTYRPDQLAARSFTMEFQLDGTPRKLLLLTASAASAPKSIEETSTQDLSRPDGAEEDLIVISAPQLQAGVQSLVDQRRQEGLSVRSATIREVYDQFNGGRPWPTAIRNYLRYLFRTRGKPPSYLLLVGEASDDFAHVTQYSRPNLVPTQTLFSNAYDGSVGPVLAATDEWFVDNLTGTGERLDLRPDMHVGRLSVRDEAELDAVVSKILAYGQFEPTDTWRSRGLLVADDEFSNRIGFSGNYMFHGDFDRVRRRLDESIFRWSCWEAARIIRRDAGFSQFEADSFYVAAYMDTVPGLHRCADWRTGHCGVDASGDLDSINTAVLEYSSDPPLPANQDNLYYGEQSVNPALRQAMNRGYLFVEYQGHANYYLMGHEHIFVDQSLLGQTDVDRLQNTGRPFFYMGFGCHLAEFSAYDEEMTTGRDCLGEKLLFADRARGSIASYASTSYEWISTNSLMSAAIMRSWFQDPPQDADGNSRWVLGEIVTGGKWLMAAGGQDVGENATYTLLGDPSMPMAMAPPRLQVTLNGDPYTEGTTIRAEAASDTARLRVRLWDEVHLSDVSLLEGGAAVPESLYTIGPDPAPPGGDRSMVLLYNPVLDVPREDYTIEVRARDGNGLENTLSMPVRLGVRFWAFRGGALREIQPRDMLSPGDTVQVALDSPVDLASDHLALFMSGRILDGVTATSSGPRSWTLTGRLPAELFSDQDTLAVHVVRRDGISAQRTTTFLGPSSVDRLLEVYPFPNPFEEGIRVYYRLARQGAEARLTVYTASGRRIWQTQGPARVNENFIAWDGRDQDGDPVANGLYLYKLEVRTADGKTLKKIDKIVRMR